VPTKVNMSAQTPPRTISELWHLLDKRLALIEQSVATHAGEHAGLQKTLDDHETRLRSGLTLTGLLTGSGGLLSLIAIIKSFLP
jgi:hypothetical protein